MKVVSNLTFFLSFSSGGDRFFRKLMPWTKDQPEIVIKDAGHFLQKEKGEEIARHIMDFMERTTIRKT